jgi:hypothetical protein
MFVSVATSAMSETSPAPRRGINAVLADNDKRLLAMPGVVGVYVGLLDDAKTPCLKVMLSKRKSPSEQPIPAQIEGYPVVIEVSGELRPLDRGELL